MNRAQMAQILPLKKKSYVIYEKSKSFIFGAKSVPSVPFSTSPISPIFAPKKKVLRDI
jgi:DNA-binding XRE family transcriptional regulator